MSPEPRPSGSWIGGAPEAGRLAADQRLAMISPVTDSSNGENAMSMYNTAKAFFEACEAGEGWQGCKEYCHLDATFSAQAEPLAEIRTLAGYAEWMKGLLTVLTDGRYEVVSFATDPERDNVCAYGVF